MFADYAFVDIKKPIYGEQSSESLYSAGAGLRLGLTRYSQMRFDYAIPIVDATDATPRDGRGHLSLQLQF
jgi:hemolysin activation/secretion protein